MNNASAEFFWANYINIIFIGSIEAVKLKSYKVFWDNLDYRVLALWLMKKILSSDMIC